MTVARQVIIYTQGDSWAFCQMEQEFLAQKGVSFVERDVMADAKAMEDLKDLGVMTTPVTVIDGEIVVGFDRKKLEALLGL